MSCCGTEYPAEPYDKAKNTCCEGSDGVGNIGYFAGGQCCGSYDAVPYNQSTQKCCVGKKADSTGLVGSGYGFIYSPLTSTLSCCGDEPPVLWGTNTQRCCAPPNKNPLTCGKSGCCTAADCSANVDANILSPLTCGSGETVEWKCQSNGCVGYCTKTSNSGTSPSLKYIP
ncbi:MAG: hypothetical protein NTY48_07245 [Candidatus Diapherotrites archaeon]|nr:hypothetical protein [Candidatus Diapherotrites archaeon]